MRALDPLSDLLDLLAEALVHRWEASQTAQPIDPPTTGKTPDPALVGRSKSRCKKRMHDPADGSHLVGREDCREFVRRTRSA
jgi:hypothetical protein